MIKDFIAKIKEQILITILASIIIAVAVFIYKNIIVFIGASMNVALLISFVLNGILIGVGFTLFVKMKQYNVPQRPKKTLEYLTKFIAHIKGTHPGFSTILAFIAQESTLHIETESEEYNLMSLKQYIRLLEECLDYEDLEDITFIVQDPFSWGDPKNYSELNDIQKLTWEYFEKQKEIKMNNPQIKMRRYVIMEKQRLIAAQEDISKKQLLLDFKREHENASIDCIFVSKENLTNSAKEYVKDFAIFCDNKSEGWVVHSNLSLDTTLIEEMNLKLIRLSIFCKTSDLELYFKCFIKEVENVYSKDKWEYTYRDSSNIIRFA